MERIFVCVDRNLKEIVPGYLTNRANDLLLLDSLLAKEDYDQIRILGHRMKGTGAGYGFEGITRIGADLELAAKELDARLISRLTRELKNYLFRLCVEFTD